MEVNLQAVSFFVEEKTEIWSKAYITRGRGITVLALDKVSLTLPPGSVTTLFGIGFGHHHLLDCIAHRREGYQRSGKILHDGIFRKTGFYKDIAVVSQIEDANFGSLTVFDYVYYGARLRISHDAAECRERTRLACRLTGLDGTLQLYQLSPSELRIVSIALEVVGNPTLLVVTDPVRGLDAAGALDVLKVLRAVATRVTMPTTVVYSLNSLSEDMIPLTDHWAIFNGNTLGFACATADFVPEVQGKLSTLWKQISRLLLADAAARAHTSTPINNNNGTSGSIVVEQGIGGMSGHGKADSSSSSELEDLMDALDALAEESQERLRYTNTNKGAAVDSGSGRVDPSDSKQDDLVSSSEELEIEHGKFKGGFYPRLSTVGVLGGKSISGVYSMTRMLGETGDGELVRTSKSLHLEVWILLQRSVKNHVHNVKSLLAGLLKFALAAVLLGCLILRQGNDLNALDLVSNANTGLIDMHAYNVSALLFAILSLCLVSTAFTVPYLHTATQSIQAEVSAGLVNPTAAWLTLVLVDLTIFAVACSALSMVVFALVQLQGSQATYVGLLVLVTWCGYSLAAVCAVWVSQSLRLAWLSFATVSAACLVFSGFLQRLGSLGGLWWFLAQLSFTRWALEGLSIEAFRGAPDRENYLDLFGFEPSQANNCIVWLVLWFVMLQVLLLAGLLPRYIKNRKTPPPSWRARLSSLTGNRSRRSEKGSANSGEGTADVAPTLDLRAAQFLTERMDAVWEATRKFTQTPVKKRQNKRKSSNGQGKSKNGGENGPPASPAVSKNTPTMSSAVGAKDEPAAGYQPPWVPPSSVLTTPAAMAEEEKQKEVEDGEDEVTLDFDNVNTLFGSSMRLHEPPQKQLPAEMELSHTLKTRPKASSVPPPPGRPAGAGQAILNSSSYSGRIRRGVADSTAPQPKAHPSFTSPTKVPLLAEDEDSCQDSPYVATMSPLAAPVCAAEEVDLSTTTPARRRQRRHLSIDSRPKHSLVQFAEATAREPVISYDHLESQSGRDLANYGQVVHLPPSRAATLTFSKVKFVQQGHEHSVPSLQGVSYKLVPSTCCCVVDGSAEGAATLLLQVLAGKIRSPGKTTGTICVNDVHLEKDSWLPSTAYVQRGDVSHLGALTVRQVLRYAAYLRRTDHAAVSSIQLLRKYFSGKATDQRDDAAMEFTSYAPTRTDSSSTVDLGSVSGNRSSSVDDDTGSGIAVGNSRDVEERVNEVIAMMGLEDVADAVVGGSDTGSDWLALWPGKLGVSSTAPILLRNMARFRHGRRLGLLGSSPDTPEGDQDNSGAAYGDRGNNKISAAQLRCLTIGTELVNRPGLVLLEDPFADLQWQDAEHVAVILQSLAAGGRTVLCSVEKPCQRVLSYSSELLLLGGGLLVYSGPTDSVTSFFTNIGFDRPSAQSDLDFVLDVAADKGKMKLVGGKRSNTLSPEDLADLNRSLVNIKAGRKQEEDVSLASSDAQPRGLEAEFQSLQGSSTSHHAANGSNNNTGNGRKAVGAPMWSTAAVLVARGLHATFRNRQMWLRHCTLYFVAGLLLGSVWWSVNDGNYQTRISLFATSYVFINLFVADGIEGIIRQREAFVREATNGASSCGAYFLSDCIPLYLLHGVGCVLFTVPLYAMAGLRPGLGYFLYFHMLTTLSVYGNICLAYLVTMHVQSPLHSQLMYAGVLMPLQLLLSGYMPLIRTMPKWLSWGSAFCPMYFYMAGLFRNEFFENTHALGDASYSNLSAQYDYYSDQTTCVAVLLLLGLGCKCAWLCSLRMGGLLQQQQPRRTVLQRMHGVRNRAKRLIKAGLRWREHQCNAHLQHQKQQQYQPAPQLQSGHASQDLQQQPRPGIPPLHNGVFTAQDIDGGDPDETAEIDFGNLYHVAQDSVCADAEWD